MIALLDLAGAACAPLPSHPSAESLRYERALQALREQVSEAGGDATAPLLLVTEQSHVETDAIGPKLVVVHRPAGPGPDYSGLSLDDVMQWLTAEDSEIAALRGVRYELRSVRAALYEYEDGFEAAPRAIVKGYACGPARVDQL